MAQQSSIEWTDLTWNPVVGCSIESAGCKNCYAMRMAARLRAMGHDKYQGLTKRSKRGAVWTDKVRCHEESVEIPLSWKKPRRVLPALIVPLLSDTAPTKSEKSSCPASRSSRTRSVWLGVGSQLTRKRGFRKEMDLASSLSLVCAIRDVS